MIKPLGHYVLVEVEEVEKVTEGGIVLPDELTEKEQAVVEVGIVKDIGPTAFVGWQGCWSPRWADNYRKSDAANEHMHEALAQEFKWNDPDFPPHKQWGIDIGSRVEIRKYEGKKSALPEYKNYRYIPDTHIIGVIHD